MSDCPFCSAGNKPLRKAFVGLVDPKTALPTGEQLIMSERLYMQLQASAKQHKAVIVTGKQHGRKFNKDRNRYGI